MTSVRDDSADKLSLWRRWCGSGPLEDQRSLGKVAFGKRTADGRWEGRREVSSPSRSQVTSTFLQQQLTTL